MWHPLWRGVSECFNVIVCDPFNNLVKAQQICPPALRQTPPSWCDSSCSLLFSGGSVISHTLTNSLTYSLSDVVWMALELLTGQSSGAGWLNRRQPEKISSVEEKIIITMTETTAVAQQWHVWSLFRSYQKSVRETTLKGHQLMSAGRR